MLDMLFGWFMPVIYKKDSFFLNWTVLRDCLSYSGSKTSASSSSDCFVGRVSIFDDASGADVFGCIAAPSVSEGGLIICAYSNTTALRV